MKKLTTVFFLVFIGVNLYAQNDTALYSFFTAGHTYGNPNNIHHGLHYPFVNYIPVLNSYPNMDLGFLTGDVVPYPTADYWDSAMVDIDALNMPIYIAAGNHDIGTEFSSRFDYYSDFVYNNDLFILLTPGLDYWNITGTQLDFLENSLDSNYAQVNNIFIFMHELIWWSPTNEYQDIDINYVPHYPGSSNFEDVLKPLLLSYTNSITLFAGDLGCVDQVSPFTYHSFDNITLIGSGMGGGVRDNIIITNVYSDSVYYDLVPLNNADPNYLGELYDYDVSDTVVLQVSNEVKIYPNPQLGAMHLRFNRTKDDVIINVYNQMGQVVRSKTYKLAWEIDLQIPNLHGIYYVQIVFSNGTYEVIKVVGE